MAKVSFRNVWKKYGDMPAVKDLNIECPDGSFLSILGPSGCGKSSTMRMVAGLEHITAGDILFDEQTLGEVVDGHHPAVDHASVRAGSGRVAEECGQPGSQSEAG